MRLTYTYTYKNSQERNRLKTFFYFTVEKVYGMSVFISCSQSQLQKFVMKRFSQMKKKKMFFFLNELRCRFCEAFLLQLAS